MALDTFCEDIGVTVKMKWLSNQYFEIIKFKVLNYHETSKVQPEYKVDFFYISLLT